MARGRGESRGRRHKSSARSGSADAAGRHPWYKPELNRRFVRLSSIVMTVGGHWERAAALLKAVWWGVRLASLLTHLYRFFQYRASK